MGTAVAADGKMLYVSTGRSKMVLFIDTTKNAVAGSIEAGERPLPVRRFLDGEILYTVDVTQSQVGRGLVLHVLHRQRKKNGEWAKPKPAATAKPRTTTRKPATEKAE